jgi:spore coat protein U-like protein
MTKKKLILAGLASILTLVPATQAAAVAGNFNVTVNLTSVCTMAAIGNLAFGTYTAFQATALTAASTTATLTCTRGLSGVTAAFDAAAGIGATSAGSAATGVGAGVLAGLQYDILATPGTVTTGTVASASSTGTADSIPFIISGTMPLGQAGATPVGAATQIRTLTISY